MEELSMPSATAICPYCKSSYNVEVSDKNGYAFYCGDCNAHFHSQDSIGTTGDGYMLCFHDVSENAYQKNMDEVQNICDEVGLDYSLFTPYGNGKGMLDVGWGYLDETVYAFPDDDVIKKTVDTFIKLLSE